MALASYNKRTGIELLALVRKIPAGRVTTVGTLADKIGVPPPVVSTLLAHLSGETRDLMPWHRIVAKGGAIGRGPHRDQQFPRLVREGGVVSAAGVVQDLARLMLSTFDDPPAGYRVQTLQDAGPAPPGGARAE
jgi:methylated-DNA-protein-cysteine methyltransferase-like protein